MLVFLRPTKEVFLFAGFAVREGNAWLPVIVLAALPLLLGGVWIFYGLGRVYADELSDAELPGIAGRLLPKKRIDQMQDAARGARPARRVPRTPGRVPLRVDGGRRRRVGRAVA